MRRIFILFGIVAALWVTACREGTRDTIKQDSSETTVASETGIEVPLPDDVLHATKPLIAGELYTTTDFKSPSLASFDTSQQIFVMDTTHAIFVRAKLKRDTAWLIGYVPKTILPER